MNNPEQPQFVVLRNDFGQYGLHRAGQGTPPGWSPTGFGGTEADCIRHVDTVSGQERRR